MFSGEIPMKYPNLCLWRSMMINWPWDLVMPYFQTKQFWVYTCHHQISATINYTDGFSWLLLRYITQHRGYDQKQRKHVLLGYAGIQLESNILEGQKRRIQTCCQISSRLGCSRQTKICTDIVGDNYSLRVSSVDLIFDRAMNHGNTWYCI